MSKARLVIISGISGSGKSVALNAFEDMGFFCVDNLPAPLITHFADLICRRASTDGPDREPEHWLSRGHERATQFALLVDCRAERSFPLVWQAVEKLKKSAVEVSLLFFDCQDEIVVRRYRETRRPHPLIREGSSPQTIAEALAKERELLSDFREKATRVIDTTADSPHDLRRSIEEYCGEKESLSVTMMSFGFKYGVPYDADLVVDVRFLPNPHFVAELRELTGDDSRVSDYVFSSAEAGEFVEKYLSLLQFLLPKYEQEGKRYLTVAVGCTGGRHRSVALVHRLGKELESRGFRVTVRHRDSDRNY